MKPSIRPLPFLNWLDDETFFSIVSRQHVFLRNRSAIDTLAQLFETKPTHYTHDFPCNLISLVSDAKIAWGSAEKIISDRTIISLFFPFQSERCQEAIVASLSGSKLGSIKYKIGLVAGRFGGEHPLRACLDCLIDDRITYGMSYWHLSHQYPGVLICPKHGCLLRESTTNRQWSTQFKLAVPSEDELIEPAWPPVSDEVKSVIVDLGNAARSLAEYGKHSKFDSSIVAQVYKTAVDSYGSERAQSSHEFSEFCAHFRQFWPFFSLPSSSQEAAAYMDEMLRRPRRHSHPLKHLILIQWLFGGFEEFINAYRNRLSKSDELVCNSFPAAENDITDRREKDNLFVATGKPKPKKMFTALKNLILAELQQGVESHNISTKFGVSISTINRLLRTNPRTKKVRSDVRFCELREKHCTIWQSTVRNNPDFGAKRIRSLLPNSYAWLYRNDRGWLAEQCSRLPKERFKPRQLDWAMRDEQLCVSIERVIRKLVPGYSKEEIFLRIPRLSAALEKRARYPKARKLLHGI